MADDQPQKKEEPTVKERLDALERAVIQLQQVVGIEQHRFRTHTHLGSEVVFFDRQV